MNARRAGPDRLALALLVLAACTTRAATPAAADADAPTYAVQPCCSLCPRAADPAAYAGSDYFGDFRVLIAGRNDWLFRTGIDLATKFDISDASLGELRRLGAALRARGTELVVVYQPPRGLMDVNELKPAQRRSYDFAAAQRNYAAALERLRTGGAVVVPPLDKLVDEHKGYDYFFRRDHHWTPAGAERTAKVVAATIKGLPAFASVPRKTFTTHATGVLAKPGTLQKMASDLCGGSYSLQYVTMYATAAGGGGTGGLLGDAARPEIALAGTSNSDTKGGYNFAGYLEQYLGADIVDVAISGGSFDGSLWRYLDSREFQQHPPKILIWEMPYQNYPDSTKNPHAIFRQIVPLVTDGCRDKPAQLENTVTLRPGTNEILFNGGGRILPLIGHNEQLDFQFSDPAVKDMHAELWYMNGLKESLKLHFNQYVDNGGRFVTELRTDRPDYADATLMGATIEIDPGYVVSANVLPMSPGSSPPTGSVSISDGKASCSFSLPATSCTLAIAEAPSAPIAVYSGDAHYANASSAGGAPGPGAPVRVAVTGIRRVEASSPSQPLKVTAKLCPRATAPANLAVSR